MDDKRETPSLSSECVCGEGTEAVRKKHKAEGGEALERERECLDKALAHDTDVF